MGKKLMRLALAIMIMLSFAACGAKNVMTLEEWMNSEEARQAEEETNSVLASTGLTVKLVADGNVFVYEYTLPGGDEYSELDIDTLAAVFDPVIENNKAELADLFSSFESMYSIKLEGARFAFFTSGGKEIYSKEVANE